jgi:predicted RNA-binding Zn ribbon-like protein
MTDEKRMPVEKENIPDTLCLDFANTMDWHASAQPEESLHQFEDLLAWAEEHGILEGTAVDWMRRNAQQRSRDAEKALANGVELREVIYRIFSSHAEGQIPENDDLKTLNEYLGKAMQHLQLGREGKGYCWQWPETGETFDRLLWPITRSAANLLSSNMLERVGQCADEHGCGWLFLDESRNHKRRWCDMRGCGNRAKARRHYQRTQKAKPVPA